MSECNAACRHTCTFISRKSLICTRRTCTVYVELSTHKNMHSVSVECRPAHQRLPQHAAVRQQRPPAGARSRGRQPGGDRLQRRLLARRLQRASLRHYVLKMWMWGKLRCKLPVSVLMISVSVCDGSPCQNGGTCSVSGGGTASCACVAGYSGTTCTGQCV